MDVWSWTWRGQKEAPAGNRWTLIGGGLPRAVASGAVAAILALAWAAVPAAAIDPGKATGSLKFGDTDVPMIACSAHLHDNAEGILDRSPELRVCITDRKIDPSALRGLGFLPIEEMARQGEVRGLLFTLQPDTPNEVVVTMLEAADPGTSLMTQTWTASYGEFWSEFSMANNRVSGRLEPGGETSWAASFPSLEAPLSFSAPLFHEKDITADLRGSEARESAPFLALKARMQAMIDGDWDGVIASATAAAHAQMQRMIDESGAEMPQVIEMMKAAGAQELENLQNIDRAVIREDRAVLIYKLEGEGSQWQTLALEDGAWKVSL